MRITPLLSSALLASVLTACGGSEPVSDVEKQLSGGDQTTTEAGKAGESTSGAKAHCLVANEGVCMDYMQEALAIGEDFQKDACTSSMAGTWGAGACPTENAAGNCTIEGGTVKVYYTAGGSQTYTADSAKKSCEQSEEGTFKPAS